MKTQTTENKTTRLTKENYLDYTDKYFQRSKEVLDRDDVNPIVRYQVFARQDIDELKGVNESIEFIQDVAGDSVKIYSLREGQKYTAGESIMKLESRVQDQFDLETGYLGILSGNLTGDIDFQKLRERARAVKNAAGDKNLLYFGARHFYPFLDEKIAKICYEEGFMGCSTDAGAKNWNAKGIGTTPHSLILAYAAKINERGWDRNPTVEAAKGFDAFIEMDVPRTILIDGFNREIDDTIATAKEVYTLAGLRIDTCGENYAQGSREIVLPKMDVNPKYLGGKGVTIAAVWALRRALDTTKFEDSELNNRLENLSMTVSSGFNPEKTAAFVEADRVYQKMYGKNLFETIGTGSLVDPVTTTSDICAYFNEAKQEWTPLSKTGRSELLSERLEEIK